MDSFDLAEGRAVLARTPAALRSLLAGLPEPWLRCDEGPQTFSPHQVLGHLIHGEKTDWIARTRIILEQGEARPFDPYDRFAQDREPPATTPELLDRFAELRRASLDALDALQLKESDLDRRGTHPALGTVTLRQLLATWVAHDLSHVGQIARVMAKRYTDAVGPWRQYLRVLA